MGELDDKVAIVTGGARGIGQQAARRLSTAGAHVPHACAGEGVGAAQERYEIGAALGIGGGWGARVVACYDEDSTTGRRPPI